MTLTLRPAVPFSYTCARDINILVLLEPSEAVLCSCGGMPCGAGCGDPVASPGGGMSRKSSPSQPVGVCLVLCLLAEFCESSAAIIWQAACQVDWDAEQALGVPACSAAP